jgi:tripartite-type tricarboxylate transporter receptor subunit TctC
MNILKGLAVAALSTLWSVAAASAAYPERTITIVVGFPPGGSTDVVARILAQELGERLKQTVVVENMAGATGKIGSMNVMKSAPDGYRLLMTAAGPHGTMPALAANMAYDAVKDFTPIISVAEVPNVIIANVDFPATNLQELIAVAKKSPGKLNYGSTSLGSSPHMGGELLKKMAGISFATIPYQGGSPLLTAVLGKQIEMGMDNLPSSLPHIQAGKIKAIAVTTLKRFPGAPNIPTVDESGLPGYDVSGWVGLLGPAGMPSAIVETINANVSAILAKPSFTERLLKIGAVPTGGTPDDFRKFIIAEINKWSDVVKANKLEKIQY